MAFPDLGGLNVVVRVSWVGINSHLGVRLCPFAILGVGLEVGCFGGYCFLKKAVGPCCLPFYSLLLMNGLWPCAVAFFYCSMAHCYFLKIKIMASCLLFAFALCCLPFYSLLLMNGLWPCAVAFFYC